VTRATQWASAFGARELDRPYARPLVESFEYERSKAASLIAGGLAYRIFFWAIALGLVLAAVASYLEDWQPGSLDSAARRFGLSGVVASSATEAVTAGSRSRISFLVIGLVLMVWFGIGAVRALRGVSALAWELPLPRLVRPVRAGIVFSVVGFGSTAVVSASGGLGKLGWFFELLTPLVVLAGVAAIATGVLLLLPRPAGLGWRGVLPGAILISAGDLAIQLFVTYYLAEKLERSPRLYGSLGSASVIMFWLYIVARLIVSAIFLNATLERRRLRSG